MIEIFEGKIGGGKTYSAVARCLEHFAKGGIVYTNIEMYSDRVAAYIAAKYRLVWDPEQYNYFDFERVNEFQEHIKWGVLGSLPVLCIIDEGHLNFNARDYATTSRNLIEFLTQSRKAGVDVIFITQNSATLDKQFRLQAQHFWVFRDLSKMKTPLLGNIFPFHAVMESQFDYSGKDAMSWRLKAISSDVYQCYNSYAFLSDLGQRERVAAKTLEKIGWWDSMKANKRLRRYGRLLKRGSSHEEIADKLGLPQMKPLKPDTE